MKCRYYSEIMQVYNEEIKKLECKLRRTQIKCNSAQFEVARLQKENNVLVIEKKQAVKEFVEKLQKELPCRDYTFNGNTYSMILTSSMKFVIDKLLKEYENE